MKDLPYYKMYPADAETDENFRAMTDAEKGFYWRCLNHCWLNGGLPADPQERARTLGNPRGYADKMWARVGRCFITISEGTRVVNRRQEEERSKAVAKSSKCSDAVRTRYGRRSDVSPRAVTRTDSDSVSGVVTPDGSAEGNPLYAGFQVFIEIWQKPCECCEMQFPCAKVDLGCQQWISLVDIGRITMENLEKVTAGLVRYRASREWHRDHGQWVPAVPTFLGWSKDGRPAEPLWNDQPVPFKSKSAGEGY